jgi:uncharacterized membrane protein
VGWYTVPNPAPDSQRAFLWSPEGGLQILPGIGGKANGINDNGQIAGYAWADVFDPATMQTYKVQHAFWWSSTESHDLSPGPGSGAAAISNNGEIVGFSSPIDGQPPIALRWTIGGGTQDLHAPTNSSLFPTAISPNGQLVVCQDNAYGHIYLWTPVGGMEDIGIIGVPYGVNDNGQVVGRAPGNVPFSWTRVGGVRQINELGHTFSVAYAINNAGVVVGYLGGASVYGIPDMAFVEVNGVTYDLNGLTASSNFRLVAATAISSDGRIAGYGYDTSNSNPNWQAFVLTPCQTSIETQPSASSTCPYGTTAFSVAVASIGPFTYQWQVQTATNGGAWTTLGNDPAPLPCGGSATAYATPLNTPTVTIGIRPCPGNVTAPQHFQIRCLITNACGSVTSNEATYTTCPADFNCSGAISVQDIFDFLAAYFAADSRADFNASGSISVQDIFDFLAAYFAGCS